MKNFQGKTQKNISLLAALIFFCVFPLSAQRLATRTFQTGDGLAHNNIKRIFQDAKGFLWIATYEGLSRFDGYNFTNYGVADGLGHMFVNDVTVDNRGRLWVATNGGGISALLDAPEKNQSKKFKSFQIAAGGENNTANSVNRLLFDAENRLWCATDDGLYRAESFEVEDNRFERIAPGTQPVLNNAALLDRRGRLWFSVFSITTKVIQIAGGRTTIYEVREMNTGEAPADIHAIIEDRTGRILAADANNIFEFVEQDSENARGTWRKLPVSLPNSQKISTVAPANDGSLWIGMRGLMRFSDGRQTLFTTANGLSTNIVAAILFDREGNMWLGSGGGGLLKLSGDNIVSFTIAEGLPAPDVYRVIEDRKGRIYAQIGGCNLFEITKDNLIAQLPHALEVENNLCSSQLLLQDTRGNWWFSTKAGLKFSDDEELNLQNGRIVLDESGKPAGYAEIYEDTEGDIWLTNRVNGKLYRIEKGVPENISVVAENVPAEFILRDKRTGTVWLADRDKIWRVRNSRVSELENIEGLPVLQPRCLFQDKNGRLWIGTRYHGAVVSADPEADVPRFRRLTKTDGLASDTVWEIAEDDRGQIYFGTGRGVDRFDEERGKFYHFTADEGAINSEVAHLLKDSKGYIWAATINGIMRIDPRELRQSPLAPPIFISQIRIAGEDLPLPETGAAAVSLVEIPGSGNNVAIRFVGLSFQGENALRYEYKLDGVDSDWVSAGAQREVNFANLGAGDYRFEVRAVNSENVKSEQPAVFEFRILRPFYLRWWFLTLVCCLVALVIYSLYRNRLRRLLEIERTRTRIATDLHDDIGSNLTKISIMSEVARRIEGERQNEILSSIAEISRSSVASMSDIVWAINPAKDSLWELTRRMRGLAEDILGQNDVLVEFRAPENFSEIKLDADLRRNVFLIFKESLNNIVRHARAARVKIELVTVQNYLRLTITDDGVGFDAAQNSDGNGLPNMKRRAVDLKGNLEIFSSESGGTRVLLEIPLKF